MVNYANSANSQVEEQKGADATSSTNAAYVAAMPVWVDRGGAEDLLQGQHIQQTFLDTDPDGLPCPVKLCI